MVHLTVNKNLDKTHKKRQKLVFINRIPFYTKILCGTDASVMFQLRGGRGLPSFWLFPSPDTEWHLWQPSETLEFHRTHLENYGLRLLHGFFYW